MIQVMLRHSSLVAVIAFSSMFGGCSSQRSLAVSTTPEPAVEAPEPEAEPEEEAPVVAEPPKNLDIQKNVIRLKPGIRILFETNSATLLPASYEILDEVASVMEQNGRIRIRVEGHTDNVGKPDYNKDLSTRRAASVRDYLVQKGVAEDRLESTGCGQDVPVADNAEENGRQQNRRVEFVILRKRRTVEACKLYKPGERRGRRGRGADQPTPDGGAETTPAQ